MSSDSGEAFALAIRIAMCASGPVLKTSTWRGQVIPEGGNVALHPCSWPGEPVLSAALPFVWCCEVAREHSEQPLALLDPSPVAIVHAAATA